MIDIQVEACLQQAAGDLWAELELGRVACAHADNQQVCHFAQRLVREYSTLSQALVQLAASKGYVLQVHPAPEKQAKAKEISRLSGNTFDCRFLSLEVAEHERDLADAWALASQARDNEIRGFAQRITRLLGEHLDLARALLATLEPPRPQQGAGQPGN